MYPIIYFSKIINLYLFSDFKNDIAETLQKAYYKSYMETKTIFDLKQFSELLIEDNVSMNSINPSGLVLKSFICDYPKPIKVKSKKEYDDFHKLNYNFKLASVEYKLLKPVGLFYNLINTVDNTPIVISKETIDFCQFIMHSSDV